jgi:hypothetical protein
MGVVKSVFAIQSGPIITVLSSPVTTSVSLTATLDVVAAQDRKPGSWADCSGRTDRMAGVDGNRPTYRASDSHPLMRVN